jgi:glycosyltransferase involved in cell wall biosynthesis
MSSASPLLSIIVPTRNRTEYVKSAIKSVLRIQAREIELVVSDNSDSSELRHWVEESLVDSRLVYRRSSGPASMSENYERAVSLASGEYLCLIGDDDGVNPEVVDATRWAKESGLDALVPSSVTNYVWPDLHMKSKGALQAGELQIRQFKGALAYPDPDTELERCARDAGQNFHRLPKAYYGIVRRSCLDEVKRRAGKYFPGVSPDMAAAISIASCAAKVCFVDYPLFVPGSSANSNAGLSGLNRHLGWLREQPHLEPDCEETWSRIVPKFYSVQTIWGEATVNALRAMGRADMLKRFNVPYLYSLCIVYHPKYIFAARYNYRAALRDAGHDLFWGLLRLAYCLAYLLIRRSGSLARRGFPRPLPTPMFRVHGVRNIEEAVVLTTEFLAREGWSFQRVVREPEA